MKAFPAVLFALAVASLLGTPASASGKDRLAEGKALFEKHCVSCHAGGGNIINPQKTLQAKDLKKHGIAKPEDIVKLMRHPGPGMLTFDEKTIPDKEAKKVAEYILKTFK